MWTTLKFCGKRNKALSSIHRVTQLKLKAYDARVHGAARKAKIALALMGLKSSGPVSLPVKRSLFPFLRSPFKHKKFQELWEMRVSSRLVTFEADVLTTQQAMKFLADVSYEGVGMRVRRLTFEPLEKYYKHPYLHTAELDSTERVNQLKSSAAKKVHWYKRGLTNPPIDQPKFLTKEGKIFQEGSEVDFDHKETPAYQKKEYYDEPGVLDEDIVYDDTFYFFKANFGRDGQLEKFLADARAKALGVESVPHLPEIPFTVPKKKKKKSEYKGYEYHNRLLFRELTDEKEKAE